MLTDWEHSDILIIKNDKLVIKKDGIYYIIQRPDWIYEYKQYHWQTISVCLECGYKTTGFYIKCDKCKSENLAYT